MAALVQLILCVSTSFGSALFVCCLIMGNISVVCVWSRFPPLCLRCFLLVCYSAFFFPFSCGLPPVANIVTQDPVYPHAFSACPPTVYAPTTPIPTIHGHPRASALVCVSVSSVHWCFWPCEHVARSCACVFVSVDGVQMCVLGVLRISRGPEPNLEPSH